LLKFQLAGETCHCGAVSAKVEIGGVSRKVTGSMWDTGTADFAGSLTWKKGDSLEVKITDISGTCWYVNGLCQPSLTTISTGSGNGVEKPTDKKQNGNSYTFTVQMKSDSSPTGATTAFQKVRIAFTCKIPGMTPKTCYKTIKIIFGPT
jgi:hypothetical protein